MKRINLLVTGLALSHQIEDETLCQACNFDYEWLIKKPASLIYADKIIVTPYIQEVIKEERGSKKQLTMMKSIKKVFEIAENFNLIDVKSPNQIISSNLSQKIKEEIDFDIELLTKLFPNSVKKTNNSRVPGQLFIDEQEYCYSKIWTIYASLILAKKWKAESLFSDDVYNYCKYKFGLSLIKNQKSSITAFDNIFNTILPEMPLFSHYSFLGMGNVECTDCKKLNDCKKDYLTFVEDNTHKYLELRDRDEIQQIKGVLNQITGELEKSKSVYSHENIVEEFHAEQIKIKRDLKKTFPSIKRWTNLSLIASTPATLYGVATGLPAVTYAGAAMAGVSAAVREMIEYSKNKYKWVGFLDKKQNHKLKVKTTQIK
jgi:hypothetical protein